MKRRKPSEAGYYRGIVASLVVLYAYEGQVTTTYRTIVDCFSLDELLHSARADGFMRDSGLSEYRKRCPPPSQGKE